jgi:hypothetical protein
MAKIHAFSASRAKKARLTRGFAFAAMAAAVIAILGAASLVSLGDYSTTTLGHASATAGRANAAQGSASAPSVDQRSDFDYFPSHYRNLATEPAERIATF